MVDQVYETECWRLVAKKTEPLKGDASRTRSKLSMPPLKHRSSSHTSTTKQGDAVQSHAYKDDDRPDTFNTLGPTPVELGKKKDHGGGIFRRFASRNRSTSNTSSDHTSSISLQHSATITSLSTIADSSEVYEKETVGKRDRKRRGKVPQEEGKEWRKVRLVLKGDMRVRPGCSSLNQMRRPSGGELARSGVTVQIFEISETVPVLTFDPTALKSTDVMIPHKSLFPSRPDKVIRFCNVPKASNDLMTGPIIGLGAIGWELPEGTGLIEVSPEFQTRGQSESQPDMVLPNSPSLTSTSRQSIEQWSTPMNSPRSVDSFRVTSRNNLPTRNISGGETGTGSPRQPSFGGLPNSETIKDLAQCRRMQEQESLGRRNEIASSISPRSIPGWYGSNRSDASGERIRSARSQASNSSLRTNTTTDSEESWRSATDGLVIPQTSPISTNFHWTKLDTNEELPSVENGGMASDKSEKRQSMTPKANRVLQFPDRDSDGLDLIPDHAEVAEKVPDDLLLTFKSKTETYNWFAMLRSFSSHEYITVISGNKTTTTTQVRSESRPSPTLYSAFSVNGSGSKAEWARVWRSLEIKIQDVKDLNWEGFGGLGESSLMATRPAGTKRGMLRSISTGFGQTLKGLMDDDDARRKKEDTLYWSISVDGQTVARTPRRKVDTDVWTDLIKLEDIEEWRKCTLRLYRRTRYSGEPPQVICIGYVRVDAKDLSENGTYEKKTPLLAFLTSEVLGQVRLSLKSDQLNVKGLSAYNHITEAIQSGNAKRIYQVAENSSVDGGAAALCRIAMSKDLLEPLVCALIDEEVQHPSATLFRSNTPLTRCLEYIMRVQAIDYVRDTIGEDIRAVCSDKSSTGNGLVNHSPDLSVTISILWNKIYMSRHEFPLQLRWIFSYLLKAVTRYHPQSKSLQLQSVSAFIFLRLVGPCIMWPESFGVIDFHPSEAVQQTLKALAKPIINLGFLLERKEGDRSPLEATFAGDFYKDNVSSMMDYLSVCSASNSAVPSRQQDSLGDIQKGLRARQYAMFSETDRDAVLVVARQVLVDVAKDTACLHRIQTQRDETKTKRDPETSNTRDMRAASAASTYSGMPIGSSVAPSPNDRTFQLAGLAKAKGDASSAVEGRRHHPRSTTHSRPALNGPPPTVGQRSSSMNIQATKMVSLGEPI